MLHLERKTSGAKLGDKAMTWLKGRCAEWQCNLKRNTQTEVADMAKGRPTKLTPEAQATICAAVRVGNYMETAAALAGISKDTLYSWLRQGARAKQGRCKEFSDAIKKALAESEQADAEVIRRAAEGYEVVKSKVVVAADGSVETSKEKTTRFDWQAAAWRLERRFPERYARTSRDIEQRVKELQEVVEEIRKGGEVGKPKLKVAP